MDGLVDIIRVAGTVEPSHQHIDAVAQADEKAGEQCDEGAGRADRAQCRRTGKPADHSYVRHIEEDLQQV